MYILQDITKGCTIKNKNTILDDPLNTNTGTNCCLDTIFQAGQETKRVEKESALHIKPLFCFAFSSKYRVYTQYTVQYTYCMYISPQMNGLQIS